MTNTEPTRLEWLFAIDWNNPLGMSAFKVFQLVGATITWDRRTWCFHLTLGLIVIRFGHVDSDLT